MMESFDLYTEERIFTGKSMVRRSGPIPEGCYRLVVHTCIFNSEGKMLIQQRHPHKNGWPGLWDVTSGGSVCAGETSRQAAERESKEELGYLLDLQGERPKITVHWEKGFNDYYCVVRDVDLSSLHLEEECVQAVRWADCEEVLEMIRKGEFVPFEPHFMQVLFFLRNERGTYLHTEKKAG